MCWKNITRAKMGESQRLVIIVLARCGLARCWHRRSKNKKSKQKKHKIFVRGLNVWIVATILAAEDFTSNKTSLIFVHCF